MIDARLVPPERDAHGWIGSGETEPSLKQDDEEIAVEAALYVRVNIVSLCTLVVNKSL